MIRLSLISIIFILNVAPVYGFDRCLAIYDSYSNFQIHLPKIKEQREKNIIDKENKNKKSVKGEIPKNIKESFPKLAEQEPETVIVNGSEILVHNKKVARILKNLNEVPNKIQLTELINLLDRKKTFKIPLTKEGIVPAANNGNHHGGYGSYVWYRDLARISSGLFSKLQLYEKIKSNQELLKKHFNKLSNAMLRLFSEENQIDRTLLNIVDPKLHEDPQDGFRNVVFVRLMIEARAKNKKITPEEKEIESIWGHKQNDALALYAHSLLDNIKNGQITYDQMTLDAKAELIYLASYFERLHFASMKDAGAWEEQLGVRTSSVGLVISFLERFNSGWKIGSNSKEVNNEHKDAEQIFFEKLHDDWNGGKFREHLSQFINEHSSEFSNYQVEAWQVLIESIERLPTAVNDAYSVLLGRLGIKILKNGKRIYTNKLTEVTGKHDNEDYRGADAAILHMLLYAPNKLSVSDKLYIVDQIKKQLMRDSGFIRYNEDWFLYGGPNAIGFSGKLPLDPDMIAVKDGEKYRHSSLDDRDGMYSEYKAQQDNKDMSKIIERNGPDLEAQWTFQDSMLSQIYSQIYKETQNKEYLDLAWFHLVRALGGITGKSNITIESQSVEEFQVPEAWIPVRLMNGNDTFIIYLASPNSPLNWSTAELLTALNSFIEVLN